MTTQQLKLAVHKFTSCDGCQLAFLNSGQNLLVLAQLFDIVHFAEFGRVDPNAKADIAFIEGSISTPDQLEQIKKIRAHSRYVITIGACATAGGIQALRNFANHKEWLAAIYATPQTLETLAESTPIASHIKVDWELWGCPVNTEQVLEALRALLFNAAPKIKRDPVCLDCKRQGNTCILISENKPCLGPVTQTGCHALCPSLGRPCYGCYGPAENPNPKALGQWFENYQGLDKAELVRLFLQINNQAPAFKQAGLYFKGIKITHE